MSKRIVLIEDNKAVRENTAEILELEGYEVIRAENGMEGMALINTKKPDLIICDIMMPELDGFGLLNMLGKDAATASIPFIFLTAKADTIDFKMGMEMGAKAYITKPFDDVELLAAVELHLKKAH